MPKQNWEDTVHKLEDIAREAAMASSDAMNQFASHSDRDDWVLVDRVLLIASRVRDELRKSYVAANVQHKRRALAIALIELGETDVADTLLEAVEQDSEIYPIAASKLANRGVETAITPITNRLLSESHRAEPAFLVTLLVALRKLTAQMPTGLYQKLSSHVSPEVRAEASKFKQAPD